MLHDFVPWLLDDDEWKHVPLSAAQAERLARFYGEFTQFDDSLTDRYSSAAVVRDPRWPGLMNDARETLTVLEQGPHGVRHQIPDADFEGDR